MKKWFAALILIVWSFQADPASVWAADKADSWTGNVNGAVGIKYFDNVVWDTGGALEAALDIDFRKQSWPVNVAMGISGAVGLEIDATEFRIGVRKIFEGRPKLRPFIGGGLDYISAEEDEKLFSSAEQDTDTGLGGWLSCGYYWTISDAINVGFDLGYSYVPVTLSGETSNAGGIRLLVLLGYHW